MYVKIVALPEGDVIEHGEIFKMPVQGEPLPFDGFFGTPIVTELLPNNVFKVDDKSYKLIFTQAKDY